MTKHLLKSDSRIDTSDDVTLRTPEQISGVVREALNAIPFIDIHTHLFTPGFGPLSLWGIDELLTYHYLEAELFRSSPITPEKYWTLSKTQQADAIWRALFLENSPISESTRGVIAVLRAFGLSTGESGLSEAREFFREQRLAQHMPRVMEMAGIGAVVMTNDPLDPEEAPQWLKGVQHSDHVRAVVRLDRVLLHWRANWQAVAAQGYEVDSQLSGRTVGEARRFLLDWYQRMRAVYMACSLPDSFGYPDDSECVKLLREAVLPACRELNVPVSLMIGVRKQINPRIKLAGDGVGKADLRALENLCRDFPDNRFLVSVLSRENQHELCVLARKFNNLMPFGCWWFLNNPSIVEEITRERIEMLGASFIPQHSDARVLEQVIYKWANTRRTFAPILTEKYQLLLQDGGEITRAAIHRDISRLFRGNAETWMDLRPHS